MQISAINFKSNKAKDIDISAKKEIKNKTMEAYNFPGLVQYKEGKKEAAAAHLGISAVSLASVVAGTVKLTLNLFSSKADKAKTAKNLKWAGALLFGGFALGTVNGIVSAVSVNRSSKKALEAKQIEKTEQAEKKEEAPEVEESIEPEEPKE